MTSVSFGDKPAGNIATVALRKTAELQKNEFPIAANEILNSTYVDDNVKSAVEATSQIDKLVNYGELKMKYWVYSVEEERNDTQDVAHDQCNPLPEREKSDFRAPYIRRSSDKQKVQGLQWSPKDDSFQFKVQLHFSPKIRKIRSGTNRTRTQVPNLIPPILTKRMILSQINGIYNPLGLATLFTVRAKILMMSKIVDWRSKGSVWTGVLERGVVEAVRGVF